MRILLIVLHLQFRVHTNTTGQIPPIILEKFTRHIPSERLSPYVRYFIVSESDAEKEYKVFPSTGLVIGFQYQGGLSIIHNGNEGKLEPAGITGMCDSFRTFRNSTSTGTILVYFTEVGFAHFSSCAANELFNLSISLYDIFDKDKLDATREKLAFCLDDKERIGTIEQFLLSQLKNTETDRLIVEAVSLIYRSKGTIRISELNQRLFISQSPFEKRFRKTVGTTPKKFASVVRFNSVLDGLRKAGSLAETCYANSYFDQAHFIKDFKRYTGSTPDNFRRPPDISH